MPYILVEDFRGGLDNRRSNVTAQPGTLVTLKNAHINRGGEIEKRPAFVKLTDLPSNSFGLFFIIPKFSMEHHLLPIYFAK